jgi:hypothetical protein
LSARSIPITSPLPKLPPHGRRREIIGTWRPKGDAGQESVVLASFANRRAAEHMLASLGREFRKKARMGLVAAFVVSTNPDGSLKLTQSRVITAGSVAST